jgi:hypothetical protein
LAAGRRHLGQSRFSSSHPGSEVEVELRLAQGDLV